MSPRSVSLNFVIEGVIYLDFPAVTENLENCKPWLAVIVMIETLLKLIVNK
jgi:hypothetical protein